MIKDLEIANFRGIRSLEINEFKQINIFTGKNNCGKTTILEALFLIVGMSNPELVKNIHLFRDLILTNNDDFRFLFYQLDFGNKIVCKANINQDHSRTLSITPDSFSEPAISDQEKTISEIASTVSDNISTSSSSDKVENLVMNATIEYYAENRKSQNLVSELSVSENTYKTKRQQDYKETLQAFFINSNTIKHGLNERIESILVKKQKSMLVEPLKKIEPRIRDISLGHKGMIYLDLGFDRLTPLHLLGEGIHRMLSILTKTLNSNNAIVLCDELEFGLHYSSQSIFLEHLFHFAETQNVQLFLTTHSRETLYYINTIINRNFTDKKSIFQVLTIRKDEQDKVYAYPYDHEKLLFAMQQDIEMR